MEGFLVFGGVLFWTLVAMAGVWLFIAVGRSSPGWALVPSAILIYLFGWAATGAPWPNWTLAEWLGALLAYFALGAVYAVAAWWVLVRRIRRYVDSADGSEAARGYSLSSQLRDRFKASKAVSLPPKPGEFRSRITGWIAYWPVAFVAYLVGDWLGDLVGRIYHALTGLLGRISDSAFDGYEQAE